MRILFSLIDFRDIGGAQMYFLELSKALISKGHTCTIVSNIDGPMGSNAAYAGIRMLPYKELKDLSVHDYDIIHASHVPNVRDIIHNDILPGIPLLQTCHSEIIPVEEAYNHFRVDAYVAIRKTIYDRILQQGIPAEKIHMIFNPIDEQKFNIDYSPNNEKQFLFAGSIDYLRKNALEFTYKRFCEEQGYKLIVVGRNDYPELPGKMPKAVFVGPSNTVEHFVKNCEFVAGIVGGRTKWEAGFCGKKYFDINVDGQGKILSCDQEPSYVNDEDLVKYSGSYVAGEMVKLYERIISQKVPV